MKSKVTALILCGGKGERLRPLTESTPKPLVCINSRPILSYLLDHIKSYEISDVVVATGYLSDKIQEFFESSYTELNVEIVNSGDADILERINSCMPYIEGDFIVFYGDTLANIDLQALQDFHYEHDKKITMTLWPLKSDFGLVELDSNNEVKNFQEKPTLDKWINIGYFYINKNYYDLIFDNDIFQSFLQQSANNSSINAFKHPGDHITVNTLSDLEEAQKNIKNIITE